VKRLKHRLKKWFVTRPALRFGLAVAGPLFGTYAEEYFWPGVALLAVGALLHLWAKGCLRQNEVLVVCGPYRFVRHPFYLSYLLIDIGLCLMIANIYVTAVYFLLWSTVYYFQIRREDALLLNIFDEKYLEYRKKVPTLIPYGPNAPSADGQSFSWNNPNIIRRSEISRLLRLALFPLMFFLAYRIREAGFNYIHEAGQADFFALSALFAVFIFSKLLNPAVKRRNRMLPSWMERTIVKIGVQLAVIGSCLGIGAPEINDRALLVSALIVAAFAVLSAWIGPLRKAGLPPILGSSAIALAWQMYWLVPVVAFYYAACAVDEKLFPRDENTSVVTAGESS